MELIEVLFLALILVPYEENLPKLELKKGPFLAHVNAALVLSQMYLLFCIQMPDR